jgi:hypothetical protein
MKKYFGVLAISLVAIVAVDARAADNVAASATATVVAPISITKQADLRFGAFAPSVLGDVTMTPAGTRSTTGPILVTADGGGAAAFTVTGSADATYGVTLTQESAYLSDGVGGMQYSLTSSVSRTIGAGGTGALTVGGSVNCGATQPAGSYTGSFTVAVQYN